MLSTSRKKALKSVCISRKNFYQQEKGYFLKLKFFQILIMVSTSININCKFLSSLGEIVFFYSDLFASKNHSQNVGANSLRKTSLLLVETIFLVSKKHFFHFSDIPGCENTFSAKLKRIFKFLILVSRHGFSVYRNFFQNFVEANPACGN